jgi:hypothetical protein
VGSGGSLETQARAIRLRGYGNSLCAPVATTFVRAAMELLP